LLENKCNVVIADLGLRPEAQKLVDSHTSDPRAVFVQTNVVDWNDLANMFDVAEKEFGGADIVRVSSWLWSYLMARETLLLWTEHLP
jgi:NAD(P)-dependent dehydrogenase (short-subunit alcohol dehydrogenase family)